MLTKIFITKHIIGSSRAFQFRRFYGAKLREQKLRNTRIVLYYFHYFFQTHPHTHYKPQHRQQHQKQLFPNPLTTHLSQCPVH